MKETENIGGATDELKKEKSIYTDAPKKFITNLRRYGLKGRKYHNCKGSMDSIDIPESQHIINIECELDGRIGTEKTIKLTPEEVIKLTQELKTERNIWHIPAMDIISILKKWGKL